MENSIAIVQWFINFFRAYFAAGFVFAILWCIFWVQRLDPGARSWNIGFRLLIVPGTVVFWPLLAIRLLRGKSLPTERNAHRLKAKRAV